MNRKELNVCAVIITLCFVVIAYSQYQSFKAQRQMADVQVIFPQNSQAQRIVWSDEFQLARSLGYSIEASALYTIGSKYSSVNNEDIQQRRDSQGK